MRNLKNFNFILYFNFWYIVFILTIKLFIKDHIKNIMNYNLKIPFDISESFKKIVNLNNNMIFETGEFNFISVIQMVLYFFIGIKYPKNILLVLFCTLLNEFLLIYFLDEGNILSSLLINLIFYKIGELFNNEKKISNTQVYSPYKEY